MKTDMCDDAQNPNEYEDDAIGEMSKLEMLRHNIMGGVFKILLQIFLPP